MRLLKQAVAVVGMVVVVAVIAMFVAPKAVRAVPDTLVLVENTPTTAIPVVTAPAAAKNYNYVCSLTGGLEYYECTFPDFPAGEALRVESFSMIVYSKDASAFLKTAYLGINVLNTNPTPKIFIPMAPLPGYAGPTYTGAIAAGMVLRDTPGCFVDFYPYSYSLFSGKCTITGYLIPAS